MKRVLSGYRAFKPFKDEEAWLLFKLAAFGEAVGWSLLISGLLIKHFWTPKSNIPVLLAGQTHGILFLIYIAASLVLAPSLSWSARRTIGAGLCSVPPYGSLIFELWAAHKRQISTVKKLSSLVVYRQLSGLVTKVAAA